MTSWTLPTVPVSAGALITDEAGRLLILKPTYKSGWTIPGGVMEADGETPWECCQREVFEETGLRVASGRLVAVDTRAAKADEQLGIRFLFDCGAVTAAEAAGIVLQESEISEHRFAPLVEAEALLRKRVRRRVRRALAGPGVVYLEDGRPPLGITP
ncbi:MULTISPECIES: NUDIX domain-containing protein [Kytococcus]|uniref:NUDIX domain-containing protein n=1 Tax=Kytococcus TaxID=57499 RepID=UPI0008A230DE|nr:MULTISPECIES: NUDIX hydrolase [Kytococcus]OFS12955.1 NUDIX hydrolase [Kytococcus sp. HMSC28H12]